jgi:hypothetical protein
LSSQPLATGKGQQVTVSRAAVVIEDRLDALLSLAALMRQRASQPDLRAKIEQMRRRDPGLRQPPDHHQLADVTRVGAIALGALLVAAPSSGLRRLGEMHDRAGRCELTGDKPPPGRRLQRDLELLTTEPFTELPDARAMRWGDPRPGDLTGLGVDPTPQ